MSEHFPVNHRLRSLYKTFAMLVGLYVVAFGVVGVLTTQGEPLSEVGDATALGLPTNPAFGYLSVAAGLAVVLATVVGRNVDQFVYLCAGVGFLVVGTGMMLLMTRPETNVLNFTMGTCIVSYVIGSVLGTAGMYVKHQRA